MRIDDTKIENTGIRISRDKLNVCARAVADALKELDQVEFIEDPNTIRQQTRTYLEELLRHESRNEARHDRRTVGRWRQVGCRRRRWNSR